MANITTRALAVILVQKVGKIGGKRGFFPDLLCPHTLAVSASELVKGLPAVFQLAKTATPPCVGGRALSSIGGQELAKSAAKLAFPLSHFIQLQTQQLTVLLQYTCSLRARTPRLSRSISGDQLPQDAVLLEPLRRCD